MLYIVRDKNMEHSVKNTEHYFIYTVVRHTQMLEYISMHTII